jgi:hypothetical protein
MTRRLRYGGLVASAIALTMASGCGGAAATSSHDEATVHGTVTVKGKRATQGKVFFNPANVNRKETGTTEAVIAKDGTYTLKTLVGSNLVTVTTPETVKDPALEYFTARYVVRGGDNTFEIEVKPPQ